MVTTSSGLFLGCGDACNPLIYVVTKGLCSDCTKVVFDYLVNCSVRVVADRFLDIRAIYASDAAIRVDEGLALMGIDSWTDRTLDALWTLWTLHPLSTLWCMGPNLNLVWNQRDNNRFSYALGVEDQKGSSCVADIELQAPWNLQFRTVSALGD